MSQQRHLAAILFTDIVGYTALMQENEQKAVALIKHYNSSLNTIVSLHEGKVLNYYGDGSLCTFPSATEALNCAMELQKELQTYPSVPLRIGLHIGEVFFEDGKALGDGVNVASRVQSLGQANTILFSKEIYDKVKNHPEFNFASLGFFEFKNVEEPIEVFALANEGLFVPNKEHMSGKLKSKLPKGKYSSTRKLLAALSSIVLVAACVFVYLRYLSYKNYSIENSVAVIPFTNMSTDPNQEYFAEGMMDEILNHLYKIGGLRVTSRTSSLKYKNTLESITEIANQLGVSNVLEGSVQKEGDHIKITAQLIDGKTDTHLWAESYDRELKDIFSIQSEIAQEIASALKVRIDPAVKERIESKPTDNTEAYGMYLRGRNVPYGDKRSHFMQAAIDLDSTFADPYADLAENWIWSGGYSGHVTADEVLKNAKPLLKKAIQLNPNLASAHIALAYMDLLYLWDFESAGKEYQKIRELNPSNPEITGLFDDYLLATGNVGEAVQIASEAYKRDSSNYYKTLTLANFYNGNLEATRRLLESQYYLNKSYEYEWSNYIRISVYCHEFKNAVRAYEENELTYGPYNSSMVIGYTAIAYYKIGLEDSTKKFIDVIKVRGEKSPIGSPSFFLAAIYTTMGKNDEAIQWLQKAYHDKEVEMYWLKVEPSFIPLHNDPRFKEILTKIGFK